MSINKSSKRQPGRPAAEDPKDVMIFARVPQDLKRAIVKFRDRQAVPPMESACIRELLRRALKAEGIL